MKLVLFHYCRWLGIWHLYHYKDIDKDCNPWPDGKFHLTFEIDFTKAPTAEFMLKMALEGTEVCEVPEEHVVVPSILTDEYLSWYKPFDLKSAKQTKHRARKAVKSRTSA